MHILKTLRMYDESFHLNMQLIFGGRRIDMFHFYHLKPFRNCTLKEDNLVQNSLQII